MPVNAETKQLSGLQVSVRKWNPHIGAYQIHHIHHVLDVPEAICFADDQLDLVVSCFDPGITETKTDRVKDVLLMTPDLLV